MARYNYNHMILLFVRLTQKTILKCCGMAKAKPQQDTSKNSKNNLGRYKKMTKREQLIELLEEMDYPNLIDLHNEYCYKTNSFDNEIFDIDRFDEMMEHLQPWDIACSVHFGHFNPGNEYFTFNGYGNIESIPKYQLEDYIYISEIVDYILETHCYFDDNDILYILNDIEEDSEQ
jgi:hypothetical protein